MDYRKKIKSLFLLILIVNALAIVRIPIREFQNYYSAESKDFRVKLHNRYEPLLFRLGSEKHIGHFVELNDMNDSGPMKYARFSMLRYILAPRNLVKISDPDFFMFDEKNGKKEVIISKRPDVVIYEGIPKNEILDQYPVFFKVNENLYILKKI